MFDAHGEQGGGKAVEMTHEHASDCAVHNAPAMEPGSCNCGAVLPDTFTLKVERKPFGGGTCWYVTSPAHPGLRLFHLDLATILEDVPRSLSMLIDLDKAT